MVDRLLTGLAAQQEGTTARWYSNKTSLFKTFFNNQKKIKVPGENLDIYIQIKNANKMRKLFTFSYSVYRW